MHGLVIYLASDVFCCALFHPVCRSWTNISVDLYMSSIRRTTSGSAMVYSILWIVKHEWLAGCKGGWSTDNCRGAVSCPYYLLGLRMA